MKRTHPILKGLLGLTLLGIAGLCLLENYMAKLND